MRDKNVFMTNALDPYWGDKKDTKKWKKSWDKMKWAISLDKTTNPKLKYDEKLNKIILGRPKDK